jgi:iron complex outermembrane receptor protein
VPKSWSRGLEFEFAMAPTSYFDFAITASFNDSQLRSTLTSTDSVGNVSVVSGIQEGNRLPSVPKYQGAAAVTFHKPLASGLQGAVTGVYNHVGSRYTLIDDLAAGFGTVNLNSFAPNNIGGPYTQDTFTFNPLMPAYDLFNLRFSVSRGLWEAALFINNLTDERALLALDRERGTRARVGYLVNPPRTFGLTLAFTVY